MPSKFMKFVRQISTTPTRLKAVEEQCADIHIELQQLISLLRMKSDVPALPPKHLQIRVAGTYKAKFFVNGRAMLDDIEAMLNGNGASLFSAERILDFGCGCGRTLIPLSLMMDPARLAGTDIDPQAISWLAANYPALKSIAVNKARPPTKYAEASFDIVLGISVFTHLPEDMQHAWLAEMSRILSPGGLGLFTTHGETFYDQLGEDAQRELAEHGFHYAKGVQTAGLPDFYQTSFQTHDYVRREWTKYFEIVAIRKEGLGKRQDLVLVRKRA